MRILHIKYNIVLCKCITMAVLYAQNVVKSVVIYRLTYISLRTVKIERNMSKVQCE